jgi:predicted SpoU family rRNA methylase
LAVIKKFPVRVARKRRRSKAVTTRLGLLAGLFGKQRVMRSDKLRTERVLHD